MENLDLVNRQMNQDAYANTAFHQSGEDGAEDTPYTFQECLDNSRLVRYPELENVKLLQPKTPEHDAYLLDTSLI